MITVKTWVSIVGETLQCQMESEYIADKYIVVALIKKSKVVGNLINSKSGFKGIVLILF